jgi:hypothetical protein
MKEVVFKEYIKSSFSNVSSKEEVISSSLKAASLFRSRIVFEIAFKRG